MTDFPYSTLPAPVDTLLPEFVHHIIHVLPGLVQGIYLTGSLPLHDFHANKSDIDFLVICNRLPTKPEADQLKRMHKIIAAKCPKPDLSGSYVAQDTLHASNPRDEQVLSFHEESMRYGKFEMAPVTLYELRTHAWTLSGIPAEQLPVDMTPVTLHHFLHENLNSYWTKWLRAHSSYLDRRLILVNFPRFTEWAVLGVARQLCTLQTDRIVSKTEAGHYCLEHLPGKYHAIVREAIAIRQDQRTYPVVRSYSIRPSLNRASKTIACIQHLIDCCNRTYQAKYLALNVSALNADFPSDGIR